MPLATRVIPVLLWDGINCVQTVRFGKRRVFGSLMDAIRVYERRNVDELILLDISGMLRPRFGVIRTFASELFCPLTIGGGVRTLSDIGLLLRYGADKVSIKTAATPEFLTKASKKFGSQAIVFALDVMSFGPNDDNFINRCMISAQEVEMSGAGEILLTSIDRNGTMEGYDLDLIRAVANSVDIPVIAHGGCGKPKHMLEAVKAGAHAAAASTMFLFSDITPRDCSRLLEQNDIPARV